MTRATICKPSRLLSLMLACGIVRRLTFGCICDRVGRLRTLLLGSTLLGIALLLFLPSDGLAALCVIAALFGLSLDGSSVETIECRLVKNGV